MPAHAVTALWTGSPELKNLQPIGRCAGKSSIHGWGAITKRAHQKGDLVIEYSGELIRPSVADAREQQLYDKLVGAGTYIFRMNDSMCVDATRAGESHSVCDESQGADHIPMPSPLSQDSDFQRAPTCLANSLPSILQIRLPCP